MSSHVQSRGKSAPFVIERLRAACSRSRRRSRRRSSKDRAHTILRLRYAHSRRRERTRARCFFAPPPTSRGNLRVRICPFQARFCHLARTLPYCRPMSAQGSHSFGFFVRIFLVTSKLISILSRSARFFCCCDLRRHCRRAKKYATEQRGALDCFCARGKRRYAAVSASATDDNADDDDANHRGSMRLAASDAAARAQPLPSACDRRARVCFFFLLRADRRSTAADAPTRALRRRLSHSAARGAQATAPGTRAGRARARPRRHRPLAEPRSRSLARSPICAATRAVRPRSAIAR